MTDIVKYLEETYRPISIVVYGSYGDGSNNAHSDFDALVITDGHEKCHDTSVVNGVQLDVFVYPLSAFDEGFDREEFAQIFDGRVVLDRDGAAARIVEEVREHIAAKVQKSREEIGEELVWCRKMLLRAERRDAEGMFRLHWLLTDSLEIFCDVMGVPYLGPKKSLKWMERHAPEAYACYARALSENSPASGGGWIDWLEQQARGL